MNQQDTQIQIALMNNDIKYIRQASNTQTIKIDKILEKIEDIEDLNRRVTWLERKMSWTEKLIYSVISLILLAVVSAVLRLVILQ